MIEKKNNTITRITFIQYPPAKSCVIVLMQNSAVEFILIILGMNNV